MVGPIRSSSSLAESLSPDAGILLLPLLDKGGSLQENRPVLPILRGVLVVSKPNASTVSVYAIS